MNMRLIKAKLRRFATASFLTSVIMVLAGFCIITNTAGNHRIYFNSSIPLTIRLNSSTPANYLAPIEAAAQTWKNVQGSFFEFNFGPTTTTSGPGQDGINLLFFDLQGVNFPPPTSVIAFSQTFTTTSGGYRAIESDLVWNARDFPPSPTGAPGAQDLQSVVTHEFGHHLGLDHTGLPGGASSGCGPQVQAAAMWWSSSSGDTSKRRLHVEDIMGVSVLYPSWRLQGTVTLGPTPVNGYPLWFRGTKASWVGPVENPIGSRFNRSGYVVDTLYTDISGQYASYIIDQSFDLIADGFGYERDSTRIQFNPPGGIGVTQTIVRNVQLQQTPIAAFSGTVRDAATQAPVQAWVRFYGVGDPNGLTASFLTPASGSFSANLPSKEFYRVVVSPVAPYVDNVEIQNFYLDPAGSSLNVDVQKAEVLIVDDDAGASYQTTYKATMERLGMPSRTFSIADSGATPAAVLAAFPQRPLLIWFTGNDTQNSLTQAERLVIVDHLVGGGRAIITGQNIAEYSQAGDTLLARYLGIQFNGNSTALFLRGFAGDVIGNGVNYLMTGGPGPQNSKDIISIVPGSIGTPTPTLYYSVGSDSSLYAGVRVVGPNNAWGATYFSFGLEGMSPARQDTFILRSIRYFNDFVTGVQTSPNPTIPNEFVLGQNYPNPFNPTTQITYGLPERSSVRITIYNSLGQQIARLVDDTKPAGYHTVVWNGRNTVGASVSSGVYLYTMEIEEGSRFVQTRKLVLIR